MPTQTKYEKTISPVNSDSLAAEIAADPLITIGVSHIDVEGSAVDVWFKDVLPTADETAFDAVAAAHTGTPPPAPPSEVLIVEEPGVLKTGGRFQSRTVEIDLDKTPEADGWIQEDITFPHPVSLLSAQYIGVGNLKGDEIEVQIAPDAVVGTLAAQMNDAENTFTPDVTALANLFIGSFVDIGGDNLGCVTDITGGVVTVENNATQNHAVSTLVKRTVKMIHKYKLFDPGRVTVGDSKIGGNYIPANTIIRFRYNKNGGGNGKFGFELEYLY